MWVQLITVVSERMIFQEASLTSCPLTGTWITPHTPVKCLLCHLLVEEVQADAVVSLADNIITEDGRVPAVASLLVVSLFAERLLS